MLIPACLRNAPNVEFVGFSDTDAERGKHFAERFNARWFDSHEALLKQGVDGVVICSENARHRELVEIAASAGVHVLCEKPIEATLEDAKAMRAVCEANNVKFMTAFPVRFSADVQQVKHTLDRGDLGRIYGINGINTNRHRQLFYGLVTGNGTATVALVLTSFSMGLVVLWLWYGIASICRVHPYFHS